MFQINADIDTSYNALEAGETDIARIPGARAEEARSNWGTTLDTSVLGSYYYVFNFRDPRFGGEENLLLRQAISMAINRETINEAVYNGTAHDRRPASRRQASPGSRRTSASTARTTPRAPRPPTRSGRTPAIRSTSRCR